MTDIDKEKEFLKEIREDGLVIECPRCGEEFDDKNYIDINAVLRYIEKKEAFWKADREKYEKRIKELIEQKNELLNEIGDLRDSK